MDYKSLMKGSLSILRHGPRWQATRKDGGIRVRGRLRVRRIRLLEGFSINPSVKWHRGGPRITTIVEK